MITKLAWKNIWRTKKRSLTVIASMVVGIWALIFIISFYNSFTTAFARSAIKYDYSHIQVHNPDYLIDPVITKPLMRSGQLDELLKNEVIMAYSKRQKVEGMIASSRATSGIVVHGIEPENEARTTYLKDLLKDGTYFEKISRNPVLISQKIADKLSVKIRSKVVLTFQDVDKDIVSASFRVEGIFDSKSARINEQVAYARKEDIADLIGTDEFHELAILLHSEEDIPSLQSNLAAASEDSVRNFREIAPEFKLMEESSAMTQKTLVVIVMLALLFGIINTMLMAVLERTRELGMLRAVGMHKKSVFKLIMIETCLLGLISAPIGLSLGFFTVTWLGSSGIDLSRYGEALKSYGFDAVFYPEMVASAYFFLMATVLFTAVLGSIYPAIKAINLNPLEAIRKI